MRSGFTILVLVMILLALGAKEEPKKPPYNPPVDAKPFSRQPAPELKGFCDDNPKPINCRLIRA